MSKLERLKKRKRAYRRPASTKRVEIPTDYEVWLRYVYPAAFPKEIPLAQHHRDFWDWVWELKADTRPNPYINIWARGGGKSTNLECAVIALAAKGVRQHALIVCETQDQADGMVSNIAARLESSRLEPFCPGITERRLNKYGSSKGWRRNKLTTASGLTVQGAGLDKAVRGLRDEDDRPDLILFDDVDGKLDSEERTKKKIAVLTTSILPAGSSNVAIVGVQNLIIPHGIFSRLAGVAEEEADFLANRKVSGPIPAVEGLEVTETKGDDGRTRYLITGGRATWEGQGLARCQQELNDEGLSSFLQERQHEVADTSGGMYAHIEFRRCDWSEVPTLERVTLWVDPAVTNTDKSDSMGISCVGLGVDDLLYQLFFWEDRTSPEDALRRAILKAVELGSENVGVETDQGGDTWESVYARAADGLVEEGLITRAEVPQFESAKAGAGHGSKLHRQQQTVLTEYERGQIVHVRGTHTGLEKALKRFGIKKPYDGADALFWAVHHLRQGHMPTWNIG